MTLISEILVPWGYTDHDASSFGFWVNIIGIAGGIVAAMIISKTGKYKLTFSALIILNLLGAIAF